MSSKIAVITINDPSKEAAKRLLFYLNEYKVDIYAKDEFIEYKKLDDILAKVWREYNAIIFLVAIGAVVRKIAPFLEDKSKDPAILVMSLDLKRVIPLLSGHLGGANDLATFLENKIPGCINFITTATDQTKTLAFDLLAKKRGWRIENLKALANISNRLINKKEVKVATYKSIFESIEDKRYLRLVDFDEADENSVVIGYKKTSSLKLLPKLYIGIGCNRGTKKEQIKKAFFLFLDCYDIKLEDVAGFASFEAKADEKGLLEFVKEIDKEIIFFKKEQINSLDMEFSNSASSHFFGLKGVAEPAAVLLSKYKELVFKKESFFKSITLAAAL